MDETADCYQFVLTGSVATSGNIMSLLDSTCQSLTIPTDTCFMCLFMGNTALTSAPSLPATTLTHGCYSDMFSNCTALTSAPTLPATVLSDYCYQSMFYGCTALITPPALPATTLGIYCYASMFQNCTSLDGLPALPATTLTECCYNSMFMWCSSIKLSRTHTGIYTNSFRIPTSNTGTTATNAMHGMFVDTGGTFKTDPSINLTYYTSNTIIS